MRSGNPKHRWLVLVTARQPSSVRSEPINILEQTHRNCTNMRLAGATVMNANDDMSKRLRTLFALTKASQANKSIGTLAVEGEVEITRQVCASTSDNGTCLDFARHDTAGAFRHSRIIVSKRRWASSLSRSFREDR
jgi:hypothetical protein